MILMNLTVAGPKISSAMLLRLGGGRRPVSLQMKKCIPVMRLGLVSTTGCTPTQIRKELAVLSSLQSMIEFTFVHAIRADDIEAQHRVEFAKTR